MAPVDSPGLAWAPLAVAAWWSPLAISSARAGPAPVEPDRRLQGTDQAGVKFLGFRMDVSVGITTGSRECGLALTGQELEKPRCRRVELLVSPVDDRQRTSQTMKGVLAVDPDRDERPRLHLARQGGLGENGNAGRSLDGALDVLDVIELQGHLHRHVMMPQEPVDGAAD